MLVVNHAGVYTSSYYRKQRAVVESSELACMAPLSTTRSGISHRSYEKLVLHSPPPQKIIPFSMRAFAGH